jgi:DNA adenine methylase
MALLGDINGELINTYWTLRAHSEAVHEIMAGLPQGEDAYYAVRETPSGELDPIERAARFIYLNRFCFNGLYRTNLAGHFNVPYGASKAGDLPTREELLDVVQVLSVAELRQSDFEQLVREEVRAGDFVYLDPPYAVENVRIFRQYGPHTFGLEDLDRLGGVLDHIVTVGASFVLSYADCDEAERLFGDWHVRRVSTHRNISGFAKHRGMATEVLVSNLPAPVSATPA